MLDRRTGGKEGKMVHALAEKKCATIGKCMEIMKVENKTTLGFKQRSLRTAMY